MYLTSLVTILTGIDLEFGIYSNYMRQKRLDTENSLSLLRRGRKIHAATLITDELPTKQVPVPTRIKYQQINLINSL